MMVLSTAFAGSKMGVEGGVRVDNDVIGGKTSPGG
jgi:hypothetical protein